VDETAGPPAGGRPAILPAVTAADPTRVASLDERRTSPVELLWDLVFVFAITEVSVLLGHDLSWGGVGRSLIVLALIWWAWSAFVWAANAHDPNSATLQVSLLLGLVLIFVAGLAVPHAYDDEGTLFACTYAGVRFLHLGLYADASRRGQAAWSAIAGFAATVTAGMALLIAGSFLDTSWQTVLWAAAVAIDYAGPAWLTRERLRGLQEVAVAHFAERYGLFVIICLGESIISIGSGASGKPLDASLIAAMVAGLVITVGLWWTYFHRVAEEAERRLRTHHDPVLAAADAYSYLHLIMIAGIIVFAAGAKLAIAGSDDPLGDAARLALCGGVALYLAGHAAFRWRLLGPPGPVPPAGVAALLVLYAVTGDLAAWAVVVAAAVVLVAVCAVTRTVGPAAELSSPK
jgi:low temperature requirement protein LtrA